MEGREENDQQEGASSLASVHSGDKSVSPSKETVVCKVCNWTGKSLLGHLRRSKSHCQNFYDMDGLAEDAKKIHLQKKSKWESDHRAERSEGRSQQRRTPQKKSPVKRTSLSKSSPASPRKQSKSADSMDEAVESVKKLSLREKKCRNCGYNKGNLRRHLAHTTKECSNSYSEEELMALENEARNVQSDKKEQWQKAKRETPQEVCNLCGKVYVGNINRHMAEAHNSETHKCPKCPKMFRRKHYLQDHLHTVHGEKELLSHSTVCSECNKEFSLFQSLKRHILEVHNKCAPFYCSICKFSFARKEHLDRHNRDVHQEFVDIWICKLCEKEGIRSAFKRWDFFTRHIDQIHYKEKNWHCDQCPKSFTRWANLNRHISIEHDEEIMFSCPVCSRNFNWIEKLNRHMKEVHEEESKFECDGCSRNFSRLENLKRHQNSSNCIIHYQCQYCHDENLYFKSEKEARKHFLWDSRTTVYSCVIHEKEKQKRMKEFHKKIIDEANEEKSIWYRKWDEMPKEWKDNEIQLQREAHMDYWKERIGSQETPENKAKLKEKDRDFDILIHWPRYMVNRMREKYGRKFLSFFNGPEKDNAERIKTTMQVDPASAMAATGSEGALVDNREPGVKVSALYDWALVDNGEPGVKVRALYDYEAAEEDEIGFKVGELVGAM